MTTTGEKFNRIPDLVRELNYLATHQVHIGIFADAERTDDAPMLVIAYAHEFGAKIPKRQARFEDLDDESPEKWIIIPERSYLRAGFDANADEIQGKMEYLLGLVLDGKITGQQALNAIGGFVATRIQAYLTDLKTPPLAESTIRRKGSSNPLIDTGQLRDSITWQVVPV